MLHDNKIFLLHYSFKGNYDIVLLQYSSAGSLVWTRQTGTASGASGYGVATTADGQYIYVTGSAGGSLNGQPYSGWQFILYLL